MYEMWMILHKDTSKLVLLLFKSYRTIHISTTKFELADHHGPPRVNVWQDPLSPSKWKEEHFVIVSLSGWGLLIFWGYKFFTGGKGKKEEKLRKHRTEVWSFRYSQNLFEITSLLGYNVLKFHFLCQQLIFDQSMEIDTLKKYRG
ncbi:hypothetical protein CerSpe_116510 [Prunus speciosa]